MTYVDTSQLTQMRADASKSLLDATCTILTPTTSANAIGERVIAWGTAGTGVKCRLRRGYMAAWPRQVAGQDTTQAPWLLTLPYGTAVNAGDRVVIDSVTYEVRQSWDEETWKTATSVEVTRLEV